MQRAILSALVLGVCAHAVLTADAAPLLVLEGDFVITDDLAGFDVDVNADGVFDLTFAYYGLSVNSIFAWDGVVNEADAAADARFGQTEDGNGRIVHNRFAEGATIGPAIDGGFGFGAVAYEVYFDGTSGGHWLDQDPGYVGFSFLAADGRHYGWAEVEIDNSEDPSHGSLLLTRIAYETGVGTPIAAGDAGAAGCNAADLAEPWGTLDLADVLAFATAFLALDDAADLDGNGLWDLADVLAFVDEFLGGCP